MEEKNKWGRPLKYTLQELEEQIEEYFTKVNSEGSDEIPDIEWLAFHLDTTRKTLLDYENKDEFSYTIKRAKDKIFYYKKQLAFKWKMNPTIFIFDSKNNHDYTDKTEIEQKNTNVDVTDTLTEEQKKLIANRILNGKSSSTTNERSE